MSISNLKSTISKRAGLAVPNKFSIWFTPPTQTILNLDLQGSLAAAFSGTFDPRTLINDPRDVALLCESCSIPGKQISTLETSDIRQPIKIPYSIITEDVTFSFLLTNDYWIKKMFDLWTESIIQTEKYRSNYRNEFSTDVVIQQLNHKGIPIYAVKLLNAYPITVNSIELSNTSENTIQKLSITMTYENYRPEGSVNSVLSAINTII